MEITFEQEPLKVVVKKPSTFQASYLNTFVRCSVRVQVRSDGSHFQETHKILKLLMMLFANCSRTRRTYFVGSTWLKRELRSKDYQRESAGLNMASAT